MQITYMERGGIDRIAIITTDAGTTVRNDPDDGTVLATFSVDRHDETVQEYQDGGWIVV